MIASLIGITVFAAAVQFVFYCRSALAGAKNAEPSKQVRRAAGLETRKACSSDFSRLIDLASLCPEQGKDGARIRAIAVYFRLLRGVECVLRKATPAVSAWANREQNSCAHFAVVALERRIASSRDLFLQHGANRL